MEPFTEEELLETINDMGYDLSPEELTFFKREMEQFLDEMEREGEEQHSEDGSVSFSSLSIPDMPQSHSEGGLIFAEQYRCLPSYENLELRKKQRSGARGVSSTSDYYGGRLDDNEILDILDDGYRCLRSITEDSDRLRELNSRLEKSLRCSRAKFGSFDGHNQVAEQTTEEVEEEIESEEGNRTFVAVDPAIRPVLHPLPGGVPFRHDPVKRYEMYRKGWEENPPPGEKKRLSLRWKVREFMLRQDVSRVKPTDLARRRISNPEWSPRPYLD